MAASRKEAAVVMDGGALVGILTDTDVTSRVLASGLDPAVVKVADAMTANPLCVHEGDAAVEALVTMIERRFRHLPVLDTLGAVVGVLDISKLLHDALASTDLCAVASPMLLQELIEKEQARGRGLPAVVMRRRSPCHCSLRSLRMALLRTHPPHAVRHSQSH